ncbi:phosphoglycerate mutase [Aeromicrobium sp. Root236]|uniref:histidine phosphatase family protein n=1 Tax=Aeromicrobium sp. Root236 TaxID=1736498 RepID=UPI0006F56407|nr:histidine phosphatase family protein [Aeromicrobium sp. Root236]KRC63697.1 phosphoglycerate mutase [Aeromicrobium sp. Root236]
MHQLEWIGIIRHGESVGNVAAATAEEEGADLIDIAERDADVPLSDTGEKQAEAVAGWLEALPDDERPDVVVVSPYVRTKQTAEIALKGLDIPTVRDERLRDRELGVLDLHTVHGIQSKFPEESKRRQRLGKFYYRPPGGESWADVLLRIRSLLRDVAEDHPEQRVLFFAHDAVVSLFRYVLEGLDEEELMSSAKESPIANCSISSWRWSDKGWANELYNDVRHLEQDESAHPTAEEGVDAPAV